ncbi:tripartite tricarboxylate transporter substrate binding protein BugE [soil metagenome]
MPSTCRRRTLLKAAAAAATLPLTTRQAFAAEFPTTQVGIVTPFAVGSGPDAVLRLISERLTRIWNQRILIDNKPGGGGFLALDHAGRLPADGYTLLQLDSEHVAALPHLYKTRKYVTLDHFDPVAPLFRTPFFIAVPTNSRWNSVGDLVAAAKAANGEMTYGSWGVGSPGHLGATQLESLTGIRMQHVPYREVSQLYANVATGELSWAFASIPSSQAMYQAGKLRYLAVAAPKRVRQMPDVPTVGESGGPDGLDVNSFVSLLSPKGLSPAIAVKINEDVAKAVADPDIRARFDTFAFEPLDWSPAEIRRQAQIKSRIYGELVRTNNIVLD